MKPITVEADGKMLNGKMILSDREEFAAALADAFEGEEIEVVVRKRKRRVTSERRAYWFAEYVKKTRIALMEEGINKTPTQVHHMLMMMFAPEEFILPSGEVVCVPASLSSDSDFESPQMTATMKAAEQWLAENLNVVINPPKKAMQVRTAYA